MSIEHSTFIKIGVGAALASSALMASEQAAFAHDQEQQLASPEQATKTNNEPLKDLGAYVVSGGESAEGIAMRFGIDTKELIEANPHTDFSSLKKGESLQVPAHTTKVIESKSVSFLTGLTVINPTGPQSKTDEPKNTSDITTVSDTSIPKQDVVTAEPKFANIPFKRVEGNSDNKTTESRVAATPTTVNTQTVNIANTPVKITTNAPAVVSFENGTIKVELTPSTNNTVPQQQSAVPQLEVAKSVPTVAAIPVSLPVSEKALQSRETTSTTSYKEFLQGITVSADPQDVIELKSVSVYDGDGLLRRSKAYDSKMSWLSANTSKHVTKNVYEAFVNNGIDTSLAAENIFAPELPGSKLKSLECYTMHWTAGMTDDAKQLAHAMLNRTDSAASVQIITTQDGVPHLMTPDILDKTIHASSANSTCVGNETVGYDLLDFTPQQTLTNIMMTVYLHRQYGMPLERDLTEVTSQPINQYGDYTPVPNKKLVGPIGHAEVPKAFKLDPTVKFVNYIFEQAVALNAAIDNGAPLADAPPLTAPKAPVSNQEQAIPKQPEVVAPQNSNNLGTISLAALLAKPVLTADQAALITRASADGFMMQKEPAITTVNVSINPSLVSEAGIKQNYELSEAAKNYIAPTPAQAIERSKQSMLNGGSLSQDEAYGPALRITDVYGYLRAAGASHNQAVLLTAVAMRETNLRPASVGDFVTADGKQMPSFGFLQIRDLQNGDPRRDPAANLDPKQHAKNVFSMYQVSGLKPWDVAQEPAALTEETIYEAIRHPNREMSAEKRTATNQRARSIATQVIAGLVQGNKQTVGVVT